MADVPTLFLDFSRSKLLDQYWPRLRGCVESLTAEQVWWRPNDASNSVGNLILHLNGNVRQWLVASFDRSLGATMKRASEVRGEDLGFYRELNKTGRA